MGLVAGMIDFVSAAVMVICFGRIWSIPSILVFARQSYPKLGAGLPFRKRQVRRKNWPKNLDHSRVWGLALNHRPRQAVAGLSLIQLLVSRAAKLRIADPVEQ